MSIHIQSFVEAHKTRQFSGKKKAAPCLRLLDKSEFEIPEIISIRQ